MIISTCGFGSTGSSAVSDYLLECEGVSVFDKIEFTISTQVDGLADLEHHIMHGHSRQSGSIAAIQRFRKMIHNNSRLWCTRTNIDKKTINELTEKFINSITMVKYVGHSPGINSNHWMLLRRYFGNSIMKNRIIPAFERKGIIKKNVDFYPLEMVEVAVKPPNFYDASRDYISELLLAMGCDLSKTVVLDQAFSGNNPARHFRFFNDPYAVVVDRDPRDLYIFAKKKLLSKGRFMPSDNVDNFIIYYRMLRDNQSYKDENPRVLKINFEEMVYDYNNATLKIDKFLNMTNNNRKTIFKPEISVANTNLIRKFPEFKEDVKKIEKALPEYLFPFEEYPTIIDSGKMFFGKSPLNNNGRR